MSPLIPPSRREALRLLGAGITLAASGCSRPVEEIVPYVRAPEQLLPGVPARYATALSLSGWARGVHAIAVDGRPIKIEGNPLHPGSLGATDLFAEAAILDLYDPDRSRTVTERVNGIASWDMVERALSGPLATVQRVRGRGLHLVTGRITSPTLARQIEGLLHALPEAAWHVHEPVDDGMPSAAPNSPSAVRCARCLASTGPRRSCASVPIPSGRGRTRSGSPAPSSTAVAIRPGSAASTWRRPR